MVVLIGSGHVAYGLGAERQARLWFDGKTASVIPIPIREEEHDPLVSKVQASYANFVWGLPPSTDPLYPSVGISTPEQKTGERYKVIMVGKESPAAAAGFAVGDELVSIDGVALHGQGDRQPPDGGEALGRRGRLQGAAQRPGAGAHGAPAAPAAEAACPRRPRRRRVEAASAALGIARRGRRPGRRPRRARGRASTQPPAAAVAGPTRVRHALQVRLDPERGWLSVQDALGVPARRGRVRASCSSCCTGR